MQEHTQLLERLKPLPSEMKVVMEYISHIEQIANSLHSAGKFACAVNLLLTDDYGTNRVRKVKTNKKDALKIVEMSAMLNSLLKTLAAGGSSLEFFTRVQYNH